MFTFISRFFGLFVKFINLIEINLNSLEEVSKVGNEMAKELSNNSVADRQISSARKREEQRRLAAELNINLSEIQQ